MQDQWIKWNPIEGLYRQYYLDELSNTKGCLTIVLEEDLENPKKAQISFEQPIASYRVNEESFSLKPLYDVLDQIGIVNQYGNRIPNCSFFKIENSTYIKSLLEHSKENTKQLTHFAFFTVNMLVEVVASYEPKVVMINNQK